MKLGVLTFQLQNSTKVLKYPIFTGFKMIQQNDFLKKMKILLPCLLQIRLYKKRTGYAIRNLSLFISAILFKIRNYNEHQPEFDKDYLTIDYPQNFHLRYIRTVGYLDQIQLLYTIFESRHSLTCHPIRYLLDLQH